MLAAGFFLAERPKAEIRSAIDVLTLVALPAWFLELGADARSPLPAAVFGGVLVVWLGALTALQLRARGRFPVLQNGIPAVAAGLLGFGLGAAGITVPDPLREPIAFPAKAAFPLLALVAGWALNRSTRGVNLGAIPFVGRRSLGAKVVALFLIIGILPLALMTLLNEQMGRRAVEQQQFSTLETYSTSLADQIDNRLDSYQKDSSQLAQDPRLRRFLQGTGARDDAAGRDAMAALQTFVQSDATYLLGFLLDVRGTVRLSTNPELFAKPDLSFREYYRQAITGRSYVSDINVGKNVPKPAALFTAEPVRDAAGTPIGVVALRVNAEQGLWSLLVSERLGRNRTAILVDSDGVVTGIDPNSSLFDRMLYNSLAPLSPDVQQRIQDNQSFGSHAVVSLALDPLRGRLAAGHSGTAEFKFDMAPHVAAFAHLRTKPWAVVVFSDLETFLEPVHRASFRVVAIGSILALVLALSALILARGVSNPLDALARSALNVARGDLRQRLPLQSQDEIGKLTEAFNHMIENLERAQAELVDRANAQAELARENARLYEQEREIVQELQRLNDLKTDFVSTVSHELRTPLTGITGLIQTLRRRDLILSETDRDESLVEMEAAARRLQVMVADLLQVSAIDAGQLRVQADPMPVKLLWEQLAREFARAAPLCPVVFSTPPDLPAVMGDRLRLEQVLRNLIGNAVKYSPRGGRIEVRAELQGDFVRFSVRDQGIGMTADEVSQLFTKFYRAGNVLTRKQQGTGLGLYISRSIVEAHGGRVSVESESGAGSTFSFTVPAARSAELRATA